MSDNEGEPTMTDHDPEFSRRTMVAGATAWLLYNVAEQRTSTAWAAGQGHAAPPHAGNPKFAEEATRLAIEWFDAHLRR